MAKLNPFEELYEIISILAESPNTKSAWLSLQIRLGVRKPVTTMEELFYPSQPLRVHEIHRSAFGRAKKYGWQYDEVSLQPAMYFRDRTSWVALEQRYIVFWFTYYPQHEGICNVIPLKQNYKLPIQKDNAISYYLKDSGYYAWMKGRVIAFVMAFKYGESAKLVVEFDANVLEKELRQIEGVLGQKIPKAKPPKGVRRWDAD